MGRRLLLEGGIEVAAGQRHLGLRDGRQVVILAISQVMG